MEGGKEGMSNEDNFKYVKQSCREMEGRRGSRMEEKRKKGQKEGSKEGSKKGRAVK